MLLEASGLLYTRRVLGIVLIGEHIGTDRLTWQGFARELSTV